EGGRWHAGRVPQFKRQRGTVNGPRNDRPKKSSPPLQTLVLRKLREFPRIASH
ncbi:uncharacterized protein EI90DRAFT_3063927, partial [Cantharellus anzutake]|uniref:uncharacterized protein n=1 Tax=Cantharellus anzutake TaxID=1750568 RepID=UPI001903BEB3